MVVKFNHNVFFKIAIYLGYSLNFKVSYSIVYFSSVLRYLCLSYQKSIANPAIYQGLTQHSPRLTLELLLKKKYLIWEIQIWGDNQTSFQSFKTCLLVLSSYELHYRIFPAFCHLQIGFCQNLALGNKFTEVIDYSNINS